MALVYKQGSTLVASPTDAGSYAVEATLSNANYELAAANDPTVATLTINRIAGAVSIDNLPAGAVFGGSFVPTYTKLGDGTASVATQSPLVCSVSLGTVSFIGVGNCVLTASVTQGTNYEAATGTSQSFVVGQAPTTAAVTATPNSVQYSDRVTLVATISPTLVNGVAPATGVTFLIGSRTVGTATLSTDGTLLRATLGDVVVTEGPGPHTVTAQFTGTDPRFLVGNPTTALTVTPEDAGATYIGLNFASTPSTSSNTATVTLRATVQDATALLASNPLHDASAGDILKATVRFVDRDTAGNPTLCSATLTLVDASDPKTAIASCNKTFDIGSADGKQFTIGIVVEGYYARNSAADNDVLTISKPFGGFITGGGYLVNQSSAGAYAGTMGAKTNWGFNAKANKSGSNLQGALNVIVRRNGRVYQIKSNAITSMSATPTPAGQNPLTVPGVGQFTGKANLQDITNPSAPIGLGGNLTVQMSITDKGEPGNNDLVGFTLYDATGGLLFSSNWNGVQTVGQQLNPGNGSGNVQVR